ncbi:hypothetical protein DICVIV_13224 [Dictyocaulus viviparus]|uniref:Calponin-homology (CH) domain-containing protein n=1 Tax=Dictyocaulus viviparus TaxID=29172 RepID=A0A0D8XEG8_DICVI|nr:hypothetical protein DICVIV_13224 [Dictyocaulus viviparus]
MDRYSMSNIYKLDQSAVIMPVFENQYFALFCAFLCERDGFSQPGWLKIDPLKIHDLSRDLSDGIVLIRLIESLQGRKYNGKIYENDPTETQKLFNVQIALDALKEDGIKTVNIGSNDVVEGNRRSILGLIWCLIQRYQISSRCKIPPKKLVLTWLQSAIPEVKLTNLRTNWNDGRALSALLEYCHPGLCPEWKDLDSKQGLKNCERAIELASRYLGIPSIISATNLNSPNLDELSCITYLSYFMMKGSCGYRAALRRVQLILPHVVIEDFESSWSDGYLLSLLVEAVGGPVIDFDHMKFGRFDDYVKNIKIALVAASNIGVESLVKAEDIADPQGDHLGIMVLATVLCSVGPQPHFHTAECFTNQQVNLDFEFANGGEIDVDDLTINGLSSIFTNDVIYY